MLRIRKDLCLGCGFCASNCPQQAISLLSGQAEIDNDRCNGCYLCLEVCPQGAIVERTSISKNELQITVASLKQRTNDLVSRIEKLKHRELDLSDIGNKKP